MQEVNNIFYEKHQTPEMNPPSALHSAMSRDRKPFTYTPGGINLSEIKSQRMAQRLMRNAMNPGVPEIPVHPVLPSATPAVPIALPNYNCLPVQVFPAMPANPKTLLRSRSNPDPRDTSSYRPIQSTPVNNMRFENNDTMNNKTMYSHPSNNDRRVSLNEYNTGSNNYNSQSLNYGNDKYTEPTNTSLYSYPYKSAFGCGPVSAPVSSSDPVPIATDAVSPGVTLLRDSGPILSEISNEPEFFRIPKIEETPIVDHLSQWKTYETNNPDIDDNSLVTSINQVEKPTEDITINPFQGVTLNSTKEEVSSTPILSNFVEDNGEIDDEQKQVKVVKKQVTKENKVQEQNGNTSSEAEMTVKLPTKKVGAKTETKVEVERKTLPDGTIEEVKTTTTKTTIDGRTEIKTRTETTIIPKEEESEEEIVEEEEEEETVAQEAKNEEDSEETATVTLTEKIREPKENGNISKTQEKTETTIIQTTAVIKESPKAEQSEQVEEEEEEEEYEEVEEAEPVTIVLKKQATPEPEIESKVVDEEEEEIEEEVVEEQELPEQESKQEPELKTDSLEKDESEPEEEVSVKKENNEEQEEEEEEYEDIEEAEQESKVNVEQKTEVKVTEKTKEEDSVEEPTDEVKEEIVSEKVSDEPKEAAVEKEHVIPLQVQALEATEKMKLEVKEEKPEEKPKEFNIPLREPSVPLDKVEDVEIKPIGITPIITKTHTENTEIVTSTIDPTGGLSKQTEYNKIENIITVNRTTKILDQNYENLTQQGVPTVKTYFPPPSIERFSASPMPSRPYQPVYAPQPVPERRHSLLLERLSMERQMPSDIYQYNNQSYDQTQYQGEPQSEVLSVSNVKPSTIANQQWYQQTRQSQNILYNNVTSNSAPSGAPWAQPKSPQPQQQYQPPQQQYQPSPQPQYQAQYQPPPPQFQQGPTPQSQFQRATTPQPQFQKAATPQPQYQSSYTEPVRDKTPVNNYSTYSPKPSWVSNTLEATTTPYSYLNKDTSQSYQNSTVNSSTQYSTGYVPPPWEQDSSYTSVNNTSEKYYQEVSQSNAFSTTSSQGWKPSLPPVKQGKNAPISYVPPAPNQSFVKPVVEVPRHPGRKTYYSEYERRYITVPESTYIPTETKFQPQPDPSPQYYYDNNEPSETVEPQWRKELREFTEKTSQTVEQTNVQPPWDMDPKYAKTPSSTYTPTPTWSQTLRPQSNRERSFESEFVSQEWPKTNTLGRRRPLSTMSVSTDGKATERVRSASVDRYNLNNYPQPEEYAPVQTHTLTTPVHSGYHNPNVPAYHTRASAEPREQPIPYQQRVYREARASPLQSRSFKYLQWITGTEN